MRHWAAVKKQGMEIEWKDTRKTEEVFSYSAHLYLRSSHNKPRHHKKFAPFRIIQKHITRCLQCAYIKARATYVYQQQAMSRSTWTQSIENITTHGKHLQMLIRKSHNSTAVCPSALISSENRKLKSVAKRLLLINMVLLSRAWLILQWRLVHHLCI